MPRTEVTGSQIKDNSVDLTVDVTNVLPVANGGTGSNTIALNNVILGNGTGAVQTVAPGTSGNVLTSNGSTWISSAPTGGGTGNVTLDGVETLTNKTLISPVLTGTSLVASTLNGASIAQQAFGISPAINQSGTASYTALLINPTETATGSGAKRLISAQVGGADRFTVDNAGVANAVGGFTVGTGLVRAATDNTVPAVPTGYTTHGVSLYSRTPTQMFSTAANAVSQRMYATPVYLSRYTLLDRIAIRTGASFTGTFVVRLGIYSSFVSGSGNGQTYGEPGNLLLDAGTVSATAANTNYEIYINQDILTSGIYWLTFLQTTTGSNGNFVSTQAASSTNFNPIWPVTTAPGTGNAHGFFRDGVVGALPSTFGTKTIGIANVPIVWVRSMY